jgi:hypothetical protein
VGAGGFYVVLVAHRCAGREREESFRRGAGGVEMVAVALVVHSVFWGMGLHMASLGSVFCILRRRLGLLEGRDSGYCDTNCVECCTHTYRSLLCSLAGTVFVIRLSSRVFIS